MLYDLQYHNNSFNLITVTLGLMLQSVHLALSFWTAKCRLVGARKVDPGGLQNWTVFVYQTVKCSHYYNTDFRLLCVSHSARL